MQLESHATPSLETPQQRYATLHRAIERGLDSDEIWRELAEVSLKVGHHDEAVDCLRKIRGSVVQQLVRSKLVRAGLVEDRDPSVPAATNATAHAEAPAASDAGPRKENPNTVASRIGLQDHLVDAVQYLFHQHMPLLVLMTTLAFPVVVGLGGILTAGGSPFLLAAIAALPGLMVLAVTGAMGRQILVTSSQGIGDVPNVPEFQQLVADARRFLADAGVVLGSLLAPTLVAMMFGAPLASTLPGLAIGGFFTPLAWALRQLRGDLQSLSPIVLWRGVTRCGIGYLGLVPVCWLLFAPAATVGWIVFGRPVWVQIAMIGPLCVLPLFVMSRLLGTWVDARRTELASLLVAPPKVETRQPAAPVAKRAAPATRPAAPAAAAAKVRLPQRPEQLQHFTPPNLKRGTPAPTAAAPRPLANHTPLATPAAAPTPAPAPRAPAALPKANVAATPARPVATSAPRPVSAPPKATSKAAPTTRPAAAPTAPAPTPAPAPAKPPTPRREPRAIEGRSPRRGEAEDTPDLTKLPGAFVVSGRDRQRQGAASRRS